MNEMLFYDLRRAQGVAPGLAVQVCREIGRRIVSGNVQEGELIEDESALAERFGVSKPVIREGVKLLVGKGLLEVRRGSGTRVRRRANWALLDDDVLAWHLAVEPRPDFLGQLMEVRRVIEPQAAAWAAQSGAARDIEEIEAAQKSMEEDTRSIREFVVADAKFHRAVLRAANNEILLSMEGVIFSALLSSIRITNADPRENERSIPLHRKVLEAIQDRDPSRAAAKMTEHLDDTSERLSAAIGGFSAARREAPPPRGARAEAKGNRIGRGRKAAP